jgi:glycosyltransferase involved in cell wall biosynthesis
MLGRVPHSELVALFKRASVYVSAVPSDGVSSSLLEAMSAGLLPVVVDNEPNRQWLDGTSTGSLVPQGDADALAAAMTRHLSGGPSDEHARMINRATVVERADRRRNLGRMLGWWQELVESRR